MFELTRLVREDPHFTVYLHPSGEGIIYVPVNGQGAHFSVMFDGDEMTLEDHGSPSINGKLFW